MESKIIRDGHAHYDSRFHTLCAYANCCTQNYEMGFKIRMNSK